MIFALFLAVQCDRTISCTNQTTLIDLDETNYQQIIGGPHPVFVRMENEGCPFAATSNKIWKEAASLFPNIIFARAECLYHYDICKALGGDVSPSHFLFGKNQPITDTPLDAFGNPAEISSSSMYFVNSIYKHLNYYPFDSASIEELIPESTHLFFESYKYPVFVLYDSTCFEDSDFLAEWLVYATDEHTPSNDYGFGKIDCSKYPDECRNWGSTHPSANVFSREKGISVSITQSDNIDSRVSSAISFIEQQQTVIPTPAPYVPPLSSPVPVIKDVRTITVDELQNRKVEDIRQEYNAAKQQTASSDYNGGADVYACADVSLKQEAISDCIRLFNFYRKLAGVTTQITNDASLNDGCYTAAKYSSRAASISHTPNSYFQIYCDFGNSSVWQTISTVLRESNLALGKTNLLSLVSQLIDDEGEGNEGVVGHRRSSLLPYLQSYGIGYYPLSKHNMGSFYYQYPPVGVFRPKYDYSTQALGINFIAWPPAGPFPLERLPSSFSIYYPGFDASGITASNIVVKLTRDDGTILECSKVDFYTTSAKMMNAVVFKLTDKSKAMITAGHSVHVQVYLLTDSVRDCLDYTIDFFDDATEEQICFYNSDKRKCPATVSDDHKYGPNSYSTHQGSGTSRTIVHVVEDITTSEALTFDYSKAIIVKGSKISGKVIISPTSKVDFANPTSTDIEIQVNPSGSYQIGQLSVPVTPKSISLSFTATPTKDTRVRSLLYVGPYADIRFDRRITTDEYYFYYSIAYNGLESYLVCTPVSYVQYALNCLETNCYAITKYISSATGKATAYYFGDFSNLPKLKTNKKKIKIYASSDGMGQEISSDTLPDYSNIDYEVWTSGKAITLRQSASLSKKAKSLSLYSYTSGTVNPSFAYSDVFETHPYYSDFKIYDFKNLYISDLPSSYKTTAMIPDLLGNDKAKEIFKLKLSTCDERTAPFTDESGTFDPFQIGKNLYITNGLHDAYTFIYSKSPSTRQSYVMSPSPETISKPIKIIYAPDVCYWIKYLFIKDYQDVTIQTKDTNYLNFIQLVNVSRVKFIDMNGNPFNSNPSPIQLTGNAKVDFSSDIPFSFPSQINFMNNGETKGTNCSLATGLIFEANPTLKEWVITTLEAYGDTSPVIADSQIRTLNLYQVGAGYPKVILKNSKVTSFSLQTYPEDPWARLLTTSVEPRLIAASTDSALLQTIAKTNPGISNTKYVISKDQQGLYLVNTGFDASQAPESIPTDIAYLMSDEHFEVNPTPPPAKPAQTPYPEIGDGDKETDTNINSETDTNINSETDTNHGSDEDENNSQNGGNSGGSLSSGAIAAIVICIILAAAIAVFVAFVIIRRRQSQKDAQSDKQNNQEETKMQANEIEHQIDELEI